MKALQLCASMCIRVAMSQKNARYDWTWTGRIRGRRVYRRVSNNVSNSDELPGCECVDVDVPLIGGTPLVVCLFFFNQ